MKGLLIGFISMALCLVCAGQDVVSFSDLPAEFLDLEKKRLRVKILPDFKGFQGDRDKPDVFEITGTAFGKDTPIIAVDSFSNLDMSANSPLRQNPLAAAVYQAFLVKEGRFSEARSFVRSNSTVSAPSTAHESTMQSAFWSDGTLKKVQESFRDLLGMRPVLLWELDGSSILFCTLHYERRAEGRRSKVAGASRLVNVGGYYFIHPPILNAMSENPSYANLYNAYLSESLDRGDFVTISEIQR